jgi:hypothetical protein
MGVLRGKKVRGERLKQPARRKSRRKGKSLGSPTGTVDFNIHHHRGSEVFHPVKRNRVERASGSFRSRAPEDHCLMWSNTGTATVKVRGDVVPRP